MNEAPVVRLESLEVSRGGRTLVRLDRLAVRPGEFVAVLGPNGAGKSTVLRALTGEWPSRGTVELFGRPLGQWRRDLLARRLAVMSQSTRLTFDFTVEEVVALGRLPHRGEPSSRAREAVSCSIGALGLQPYAHRAYTTLSGGEQQRVQFARVVAQLWGCTDPRLLLLDEPTSALDLRQQRSVLDLAHAASRAGASVVAVMHDLNLAARFADRVCVMSAGAIRVQGAPADCLRAGPIRDAFGTEVVTETARSDGLPVVLVGVRRLQGEPPG
jgi:iron complex transport system ATP-binding protein